MIPLVLTFVGDDRPGLVNAIAEAIAASGATWLESRSAELAGKFAGILLAKVPDANLAALEDSLRRLEAGGLHVTIERGAPSAEKPSRLVRLDILGNERPGIVRDVTQVLSGLGVNIGTSPAAWKARPFPALRCFAPRPACGRPTAFRSRICARRWSASQARSWSISRSARTLRRHSARSGATLSVLKRAPRSKVRRSPCAAPPALR